MSVDKNKVNQILIEFQEILKKFRPNTSELQLINKKISQMTARNLRKSTPRDYSRQKQDQRVDKQQKSQKKRYKINIE